ncbi:uncharacterized protein K452DRAFT_292794 [Aplosporella prunicola CBS 121167]|uniref:Alpha/beta hydrolase fold-3 domain-containing protein n=1 Tax=Aplosporella prunicola CBS 121167 TaxID=1176127 RepID=A0A6A6AXI7_9PEZI|nr:uncharacterized protein K452DRAFT_292794 [Aplosporella prunicola CBS 121167]KAF2135968.1 hypothetical protein K452DRAFT_292794 [Aplosporella prunicola CBS 121167]
MPALPARPPEGPGRGRAGGWEACPYPFALNECYDVYHMLVASRGRCIGLSGEQAPKLFVAGDGAGGDLAVGMVFMVLQAGSVELRHWHNARALPPPEGIILLYPALDLNVGNWMTEDNFQFTAELRHRGISKDIPCCKDAHRDSPVLGTSQYFDDKDDEDGGEAGDANVDRAFLQRGNQRDSAPAPLPEAACQGAQLVIPSKISYLNDRILAPELMRAMVILYVGPHNRPDFRVDFLLSPLVAPDSLLAMFPKTYFLTGERDPLVDDTLVFAGRLRQAKMTAWQERLEMGLLAKAEACVFKVYEHVEMLLLPGISHGFLQFLAFFPEGWGYISKCAQWMLDTFQHAIPDADHKRATTTGKDSIHPSCATERRGDWQDTIAGSVYSSEDEDRPLEIARASRNVRLHVR